MCITASPSLVQFRLKEGTDVVWFFCYCNQCSYCPEHAVAVRAGFPCLPWGSFCWHLSAKIGSVFYPCAFSVDYGVWVSFSARVQYCLHKLHWKMRSTGPNPLCTGCRLLFMFLLAIMTLLNWNHTRKSKHDWQVSPLCCPSRTAHISFPIPCAAVPGGSPASPQLPSHLPELLAQHPSHLMPLSFFKNRFSFEENHLLL